MRILIADDDTLFVRLLAGQLGAKGFSISVAYDALQVMQSARQSPPDAILLDILLPGGTGLQVLQRLKASAKTSMIPVLVISVSDDPTLPATVQSLGAEGFFHKPVDIELVVSTLGRILGGNGNSNKAG